MKALPTYEQILFLCLLHEKCHLLPFQVQESVNNMALHTAASPRNAYVVLSVFNFFTFVIKHFQMGIFFYG